MRRFLVNRTSNVNVVQPEVEVEEPPPNVANEFNPNDIVRDPGRRKQIHTYAPDIQDQVRRAYILKGPMQPNLSSFPRTPFGSQTRAFCRSWYEKYTWIEYSEFKDAAYCFYCFLFKKPGRAEYFGFEVFTKDGFKDWKHASKGLQDHIDNHDSMHNSCIKHYDDYNNQRQSIESNFARATKESEELYKIRLTLILVYKLIELALILPVSTAYVERAFSALKVIKTKLRNKMNNAWLNDLMICYTEREIFKSLDDVDIIRTFTRKRSRKGHLPHNFI